MMTGTNVVNNNIRPNSVIHAYKSELTLYVLVIISISIKLKAFTTSTINLQVPDIWFAAHNRELSSDSHKWMQWQKNLT